MGVKEAVTSSEQAINFVRYNFFKMSVISRNNKQNKTH